MSSLWARIEPLLARVQKPARYIGCEDGAATPRHAPGKVSWLLAYPDTYEIGLPNQGLQILYEILNERDDAVAERTYAPWSDLEALMRRHDVPLFSVDTHRAGRRLRPDRVQPVGRAGVHQRAQHGRSGRRARCAARDREPHHPLVVIGGHCAFNPEPLADYVDLVVLGEGEEVIGEITEVVRDWKASRPHAGQPRGRAARAVAGARRVRAVDVRRGVRRRPRCAPSRPRTPTCRRRCTSAPSPIWASGRTRSTRWPRSPKWCTTGSASRCSAAAPVAAGSARRA